jgi:predicted porin
MTRTDPRVRIAPIHRRDRWLLAAAATVVSGAAGAGDFSLGAGVGADRGRVECVDSFSCDSSSGHWKVFAGYRWGEAFELQAVYFDAGRFKGGGTTPLGTEFGGAFEVRGIGLTGGYRWAFSPSWSLVGRAGLASVRTRFDYADATVSSVSKTNVQPLLGLGLAYAVTPAVRLSLDYDVSRFKVHTDRGSLQMLGLSAQYSFR